MQFAQQTEQCLERGCGYWVQSTASLVSRQVSFEETARSPIKQEEQEYYLIEHS